MPTLTVTKSYSDGAVLNASDLDDIISSIETLINTTGLDDDNIQNSGITASTKLVDGSISAAKIATSAVTTAKINDAAVTTDKIADAAVTAAKLATAAINTVMPAGAVLPYAGSAASPPTGYLTCDGSAVSRTTYATLYAAIGVLHGQGDGSTTFNLPDYRGRFLRGSDNMGTGAASRDPDAGSRTAMNTGGATGATVGSIQADATAVNGMSVADSGHQHFVVADENNTLAKSSSNYVAGTRTGSGGAIDYDLRATNTAANVGLSSSTSASVSLSTSDNETRPLNANVNYIIKT